MKICSPLNVLDTRPNKGSTTGHQKWFSMTTSWKIRIYSSSILMKSILKVNRLDVAKNLSSILNDIDWFNIDKRFKNRLRWVHIKSLNWTLGKRRNLYVTPYHYHCWKDNIGTKLFWSRHASLNNKASLYLSKKGHKTAQTKNIWLKSWKWRKYVLVH